MYDSNGLAELCNTYEPVFEDRASIGKPVQKDVSTIFLVAPIPTLRLPRSTRSLILS